MSCFAFALVATAVVVAVFAGACLLAFVAVDGLRHWARARSERRLPPGFFGEYTQ